MPPHDANPPSETRLCPSSRPEMPGSRVFAVVGGTAREPRAGYLQELIPTAQALPLFQGPVTATEVLRFTAACGTNDCRHYDGARCRLAARVTAELPAVVDVLPACRIRHECRWFNQEGREACLRCPQVVTDSYNPSDAARHASDPAVYG